MQWRHLWRRLAHLSRVLIVAVVSVALTLTTIAGLAIGMGSLVVDRLLARHGISDWSITIASVNTERVVIQQLTLTLDPPAGSTSTDPATPLTLNDVWDVELPSWLPDTLIIKEFEIRDRGLTAYQQYAGQLTLALNPIELTLALRQPRTLTLHLVKQPQQLVAQLTSEQVTAQATYRIVDGGLTASVQSTLPITDVPAVNDIIEAETVGLAASLTGKLQPSTAITAPAQMLDGLTAKLTVALTHPLNLHVNNLKSTLTGDLALSMNNGLVNHYQLTAQGQVTELPAVKIDVSSVDWQLTSADQLSVAPMQLDQLLQKRHWPVKLSATVNGTDVSALTIDTTGSLTQQHGQFEQWMSEQLQLSATRIHVDNIANDPPSFSIKSLQMPVNMTLTPEHLKLDLKKTSNQAISAKITSELVGFSVVVDAFNANIPIQDPINSEVSLSTKIDDFRFDSKTLKPFKPIAEHTVEYNAGVTQLDGSIRLPSGSAITHQTRITADNQLSSSAQISVADIGESPLKPQLANYMSRQMPLFSLNDGSATANFKLAANLNNGQWQISNGNYQIQHVDAIYDTTAVANANLAGGFSATPERVQLTDNQLYVGSVQQGFSIGPIEAKFNAEIPFDDLRRTAVELNSHRIKAFSGTVTLPNQTYQLTQPMHIPVVFERLSLGEIMRQYPTNKVALDGSISGTLPLHWDTKQLTVDKGYISAVAPGGLLQVDSSALRSAVGSRPRLQTAVSILENFHYRELSSVIDYDANGELTLHLQLVGYNPAVENGRTVKLNINIEEDLPALIKGLQLSNSVSDVIRKRIQRRIN